MLEEMNELFSVGNRLTSAEIESKLIPIDELMAVAVVKGRN